LTTLAETLANHGYRNAAFSANTSYVAPEWGLGRGFSRFDVHGGSLAADAVDTVFGRRLALNLLPRAGYFDIVGRKRAADVNRAFLAWLDHGSDRPFFALLNYLDVHDPYITVAPYDTSFSARPARGDVINFQFQPHAFRRKATIGTADVQAEIDAYDGCLRYLDSQLGALFAELERRGLDGETLTIITADHGESFGNHDLFGHGNSLYFETLHVPLVVIWPGHVPAGRRLPQVVGLDRLPATVEQLVEPSATRRVFPGRSLRRPGRRRRGRSTPRRLPNRSCRK
jgi:arylsulfatase A-like enzyme